MKPTAWKFEETGDGVIYSIQFDEVPWKMKKALESAMIGWNKACYGWHKTTGNHILLYKRKFNSLQEWENWAAAFPLQIVEKRYWGNKEKNILHGKKAKNG